MAVEPLYCTQCGAEDFDCDCGDPLSPLGEYCDVCGAHEDPDEGCEYCEVTPTS